MAKKLADARVDMVPQKPKEIKVEPVLEPYLGKIVSITTREIGCDLTVRVSNKPSEFQLSDILKISK